MRSANVYVNNQYAGELTEVSEKEYKFTYSEDYQGLPVSLTMPISIRKYSFKQFPPFFEGLLPEGILLESLLRTYKLDRNDYFGQLLQVGKDLVGAVTVEAVQ